MIINLEKPCKNLMSCDFEDKTILSFELDKQQIKNVLKQLGFEKIYNFQENIDFIIQIDSVPTFDSVNLREYSFKEQHFYTGNIVYSCILKVEDRQLEEQSTFYYRIKIKQQEQQYNIKSEGIQGYYSFEFISDWSKPSIITIKKDYTLDILHSMYNFIADHNSYNKEVKSANFYYFLLSYAKEFNKTYEQIIKSKELFLLNNCDTNKLDEVFGNNYGFNIPFNMNTEEYRRLIMKLRSSYMNAGNYKSIKENLIYFFGEEPIFRDYRKIFPWILRKKDRKIKDPENPSYYNYKSNYYLYSKNKQYNKKKNEILLLSEDFKKFNFEIKIDNFFNVDFIEKDIKTIINKLKPVYTKYILVIEEKEEFNPPPYVNPLLVNDTQIMKGSDDTYIKYK